MTVIIMKQTAIGKRAYAISREDADALVAEGRAVQDKAHSAIYEEITPDEAAQGYMTRNLEPIPAIAVKRKPGRPPKTRVEEPAEDKVETPADED
ncbi:MAG: hypothetical protein ACO3Z6_13020 [Pseudomonadales bacterium]